MRSFSRERLAFALAFAVLGTTACGSGGGGRGAEAPEPLPNQSPADERMIRDIVENQTEAWNRGDAARYSRDFARDGIATNIRGQSYTGYDAFLRQHEMIFRGMFRGSRLDQDIDVLRFPEPGVAIVETIGTVSRVSQMPPGIAGDGRDRLRTRLLQVLVKRGGEWKIVAFHNVDVKPGT